MNLKLSCRLLAATFLAFPAVAFAQGGNVPAPNVNLGGGVMIPGDNAPGLLGGCIYRSTAISLVDGQQAGLGCDSSGHLIVTGIAGATGGSGASTPSGTPGTAATTAVPTYDAVTGKGLLTAGTALPAGTNNLGGVTVNLGGATVSTVNPFPVSQQGAIALGAGTASVGVVAQGAPGTTANAWFTTDTADGVAGPGVNPGTGLLGWLSGLYAQGLAALPPGTNTIGATTIPAGTGAAPSGSTTIATASTYQTLFAAGGIVHGCYVRNMQPGGAANTGALLVDPAGTTGTTPSAQAIPLAPGEIFNCAFLPTNAVTVFSTVASLSFIAGKF